MDELCESEIDNGFLQRPRRNIRDTTGSGGENGMIILNLCEHINGAEIRRIEKRACQQSSINDRVGRWMSDKRRALNLRHRNLCLMFKGISPQAWSRQITRVLAMAPVHKRNASFRILCNGFRRLGDSIPYSITDLTSDRYTVSNGRLPAPQDAPFNNLIALRRSRHIAAALCICSEYEPLRWNATPTYLHSFFSRSWVPSCRIKDTDAGLCFLVNNTAADLVLESLKPHWSHQLHTFVKERWHSRFQRVKSEPHSQKHNSSVYNAAGEVIHCGRSFIVFSRHLVTDKVDLILTRKVRLERKERMKLNMRPEMPYRSSLERTSLFTT